MKIFNFKLSTIYYSLLSCLLSTPVKADDTFNVNFLRQKNDAPLIDISRFNNKNAVLAGEYPAEIYVNEQYKGSLSLIFADKGEKVVLCLTPDLINLLDLNKEAYSGQNDNSGCLDAEIALTNINIVFDTSLQRLNISAPQALIAQRPRDYISPSQWQDGVPAAFINYDINNYHYESKVIQSNQQFISIRTGANIGSWALRHSGSRNWYKTSKGVSEKSRYQNNETYLQKDFATIQGLVTLGEFNSQSKVQESIGLRGIQVSSDDRMLASSQRGYAPVIQGIANTNALITIKQDGNIIYQTNVPAGPFNISDLYPSGSNNDLTVEITEANGVKRSFNVPYASLTPLIRMGQFTYQAAAGHYRYGSQVYSQDKVAQLSFQYGLLNALTINSGAILHKDYRSLLLGAGFNTPLGAFTTDATLSRTYFSNSNNVKRGYSIHASYSVNLPATSTNVTLAAYRYSSRDFYNLRDAIFANHSNFIDDENIHSSLFYRPKNQYQISINQRLGEKWGNFYIIGSTYNYWNSNHARHEYQFSYSNTYKSLSYQFGFSQSIDRTSKIRNNSLYVNFSLPIGGKGASVSTTMANNRQYHSLQTTFSDSMGENNQFNYNLSAMTDSKNHRSTSTNLNYRTNIAEYSASAAIYNDGIRQYGLGANGSIVAHPYGITLGNSVNDNFMIVHAKNGHGAKVNTGTGQTLDYFGNAIVPYSTPYSINYIGIDTSHMPNNLEFSATEKQVIPRANSINLVNFESHQNTMILFKIKLAKGGAIPMAAEAKNSDGSFAGFIGQGGMLFANSLTQTKGNITVRWGANESEQCQFNYNVNLDNQNDEIQQYEAICR
ncbi:MULTISPECIES: fimbria/pilus outer membrane usher protein [Haemophilus]|uniref:Fimbrial usher protein n=1 Tax=Haemophilus aegyptius TaxID=197575 RepID=A0ABY1VVP8_HAEAE|nr:MULTISPECIES: fimbria/pilus outer membrane usher protein [Haemophilus]EGF16863.1 outer membrane usher protein HifC [Haemophilus aegyptius ATCC 11116]OBX82292.1 usher protein [Haemophilus aegyptius]TMQ42076.1 usher protein [Haemophilus influenzae biotype aegyptius]UAK82148.1 fimbrial biogenesis outer membrane usher protein [Haemophilus aegyptius]SQH38059.1 fimbrial usher protein [Haemophilus aegyptius]